MKFLDLFSGIGGFHIAASETLGADAECVGTCEIDPKCKTFLTQHFKIENNKFVNDITSLFNEKHENPTQLAAPDILFAGFPCQPFSNVGLRQGFSDSRGLLFFDLVRVIEETSPNLLLLENVQKIKTLEGGRTLDTIVKTLEQSGYHTSVWDLQSSSYGLPQKRRRIFIAGIKGNRSASPLPPPQRQDLLDSHFPTTYDLLERSMPERHIVPYGSRKTVFEKNSKWMGNLSINNQISRPLCASMGKWHRANQDNYFTEDFVFEGSRPDLKEYHWPDEKLRRILPVEGLRLQGFPQSIATEFEDLKFAVTSQYKMLGNAVPVNLASAALNQLISHA